MSSSTTQQAATPAVKKSAVVLSVPLRCSPMLGSDPEFFFKENKRIIGAERVIPKGGMNGDASFYRGTHFIIDGVQVELNPVAGTCRGNHGNHIRNCFIGLRKHMQLTNPKLELSFKQSVSISKTELAKLAPENQVFGCSPSLNAYPDDNERVDPTTIDATKYRIRSAGGHIHIGTGEIMHPRAKEFITLMDIIVGNTCVLIDRDDKGNRLRRKMYGRAGEYRLPKHGIEYRTLSNFWLHHSSLMSLVYGLSRFVYNLMQDSAKAEVYYKAFTEAVNIDDVRKAINKNDYKLAYANYKAIEDMMLPIMAGGFDPLCAGTKQEFNYFLDTVKDKGLEFWFPDKPMDHWTSIQDAHDTGFNNFLSRDVCRRMHAKK